MQHAQCTSQPLYQIFIDISKAYDGLDQDCMLTLLQDYGVGNNVLHLLHNFWSHPTIIPHQQGIFGQPFSAEWGITQGDIISPTIFNIVIDAILHHWYQFMHAKGYYSTTIKFYADDGLLANTSASNLQMGLHEIACLFKCFGLQLNAQKTQAMISAPAPPTCSISTAAYQCQLTGYRPTHKEFQCLPIACPICAKILHRCSLQFHLKLTHQKLPELPMAPNASLPHPPTPSLPIYFVSAPNHYLQTRRPVPTCNTNIKGWQSLQTHFQHCHPTTFIYIYEEGFLPKCTAFGLQCKATPKHMNSQLCQHGQHHLQFYQLQQQCPLIFTTKFTMNGAPTENIVDFKYLDHWLQYDNDDHLAVLKNIHNTKIRWGQLC